MTMMTTAIMRPQIAAALLCLLMLQNLLLPINSFLTQQPPIIPSSGATQRCRHPSLHQCQYKVAFRKHHHSTTTTTLQMGKGDGKKKRKKKSSPSTSQSSSSSQSETCILLLGSSSSPPTATTTTSRINQHQHTRQTSNPMGQTQSSLPKIIPNLLPRSQKVSYGLS